MGDKFIRKNSREQVTEDRKPEKYVIINNALAGSDVRIWVKAHTAIVFS